MTRKTITSVKSFFEAGDKPTQSNFVDFIDSTYNDNLIVNIVSAASAATGLLEITSASGVSLVSKGSAGGAVLQTDTVASVRSTLGLVIGTDVQAYDVDTLKADTADELTAGFTQAYYDHGTITTGTVTPSFSNSNRHKVTVGGNFTLAAPSSGSGPMLISLTMNATGGYTITLSGFTALSQALEINTSANAVTWLHIERDGTNTYAQSFTTV